MVISRSGERKWKVCVCGRLEGRGAITEGACERGGGGVVGLRIGDFDIRRGAVGGEVLSGIDDADTFDEGGGGECKLGTGDVGGMMESGIRSAD